VAEPVRARAFRERTAAVRDACDLPLETHCDDRRCAALVASPNLDHLGGWLAIAGERPGLVLSTVLRDAGLDPAHLPCGRALDGLDGRPVFSVVDDAAGHDWWCAVDGDPREAAALCDELVSDRTDRPFDGFSRTEPRRLFFRRPSTPP